MTVKPRLSAFRLAINLVAGILLSGGLPYAASAQSQDYQASLPSEKELIAQTGVDLRSGTYAYSQTDIAIGGERGLQLERSTGKGISGRQNPFGNFAHNWDIFIYETKRKMAASFRGSGLMGFGESAVSSVVTVSFGSTANGFFAYGDPGENTYYPLAKKARSGRLSFTGGRSSADAVFTWTAEGGTVIEFRPFGVAGTGECSSGLRCAFASKVTEADGTQYTLTYDSAGSGAGQTRLRRVVSNRGYALLFEYSAGSGLVSKTCLINLAYSDLPANNACPAGIEQTATYSYTTLGGAKLSAVLRPDQTVQSFAYIARNDVPSLTNSTTMDATAYEMRFFDPGQPGPSQTQVLSVLVSNSSSGNNSAFSQIVRSQLFADGSTYTYDWDSQAFYIPTPYSIQGGRFTNSEGKVAKVSYGRKRYPREWLGIPPEDPTRDQLNVWQTTQGPNSIVDELGRETSFQFCAPDSIVSPPNIPGAISQCEYLALPVSYTRPGGYEVKLQYDGGGNITEQRTVALPGSGLPDLVETFTWDPGCPANMTLCGKMRSATDARGDTTEFSYSPVHGKPVRQTGPASAPGAPRPETRYGYSQRSAWIRSGASYVAAAPAIWLLTSEEFCRTSAADSGGNCAAGASDEVVTTYDYGPNSGPNNLLLRGKAVTSEGVTLRTCYLYDSHGRLISETQPNANLASCS